MLGLLQNQYVPRAVPQGSGAIAFWEYAPDLLYVACFVPVELQRQSLYVLLGMLSAPSADVLLLRCPLLKNLPAIKQLFLLAPFDPRQHQPHRTPALGQVERTKQRVDGGSCPPWQSRRRDDRKMPARPSDVRSLRARGKRSQRVDGRACLRVDRGGPQLLYDARRPGPLMLHFLSALAKREEEAYEAGHKGYASAQQRH
mmetsp:Transcript_31737/g.91178  ORF Transcript_31737/g.91178 Transcript_31737/m.91178 type:complete len:200 (+) Transcript_31737:1254-1853(+)